MINKYWIYLTVFLLCVVVAALGYIIFGPPKAAITIQPVPGDFLEDEPVFMLAGQRDAPVVLIIPKGQRLPMQCEDRTERLNLVIPPGGNGSRGYVNCAPGGETPTPRATVQPTVTAEATETAVPPTPTNEPGATPTIPPTVVGSLPLCEEHDPTAYHALISADGSCHYNHTHFGDPTQLDWLAELTDSPWPFDSFIFQAHQTPLENELKHSGNIFTVNSTAIELASDEFECIQERVPPNTDGCVVAWRIRTHDVGGARAMLVRIHSQYGQVWVQNPDGSIGSLSAGGWVDWGHLMAPYKVQLIPTAQDGPFELAGIHYDAVSTVLGQPPYRASEPQQADGQLARYAAQWNSCSNQTGAHTHAICLDFVSFRDFGGIDVDAPNNIWLACPDLTCSNNHSNIRPYEVRVTTPPELGTGLINFDGWTDLHGNIVEFSECTVNEFGIFPCAPLIINNVQAGTYLFRVGLGTNAGPNGPQDKWQEEYDTSPEGEAWIEYPYR